MDNEINSYKNEIYTKEANISRLEEEIMILQKEIEELLREYEEIEAKSSLERNYKNNSIGRLNSFNQNQKLIEEKNHLLNEINELNSKVRQLEAEIQTKYILKTEYNNSFINYQREIKNLSLKLRNYENNTNKMKNEIKLLQSKNHLLNQIISQQEKSLENINKHGDLLIENDLIIDESSPNPLNFLFNNEDETQVNHRQNLMNKLQRESYISFGKNKNLTKNEFKLNDINTNLNICKEKNFTTTININPGPSPKKSENHNFNLFNHLKDDSAFFPDNASTNEKIDKRLTTNMSFKPMNNNFLLKKNEFVYNVENLNIKNSEESQKVTKQYVLKNKLKIDIPKIDFNTISLSAKNNNYKEYFFLTLQSLKLNSDEIEHFVSVYKILRIDR